MNPEKINTWILKKGCTALGAIIGIVVIIACIALAIVAIWWGVLVPMGHYNSWHSVSWLPTYQNGTYCIDRYHDNNDPAPVNEHAQWCGTFDTEPPTYFQDDMHQHFWLEGAQGLLMIIILTIVAVIFGFIAVAVLFAILVPIIIIIIFVIFIIILCGSAVSHAILAFRKRKAYVQIESEADY